jgi:VWFA-related protein
MGNGEVLDRAQREDVMIYAIGIESRYHNGLQWTTTRPGGSFKKMATETGGAYFELKKTADLNSTFTRVVQELHSQYLLGFSPTTLDGKEHKLEIKVNRPGLTARARKTYIAQ